MIGPYLDEINVRRGMDRRSAHRSKYDAVDDTIAHLLELLRILLVAHDRWHYGRELRVPCARVAQIKMRRRPGCSMPAAASF